MIIFSEMTAWENDNTVQQVLVFPSQSAKDYFDQLITRQQLTAEGFYDENGIGATYKLRARQYNDTGKWQGIIRCGVTGKQIYEPFATHNSPEGAIYECVNWLRRISRDDYQVALRSIEDSYFKK